MKNYLVKLTGKTPLLMHHDNIDWADTMKAWEKNPKHRKNSIAGDDRMPAHRWIGSLYHDGKAIALPQDMLMACFMEGGGMVPVPGAKGNKTFKSQTQSGMMTTEPFWQFLANGKTVLIEDVDALMTEEDFSVHRETADRLGFELYLKRARIGSSKHVRVRPRFNEWSAAGQLVVWDEQLTLAVLTDIVNYGGQYRGIGDWRPGSPRKPGPFGTFTALVEVP